jgi:hypothetical protein
MLAAKNPLAAKPQLCHISLNGVRYMNVMKVPMLTGGEEPILAGRLIGKRVFLRALENLPALTAPSIIALDFHGVDLATSSFLSEAILTLRDLLRTRRPPGYVVVVNLSEKVREELDELLNRSGDALLVGVLTGANKISGAEIAGKLDQKLEETFNLVRRKGETTAIELHSESGETDGIGPTAWNNRLAALASKSLLVEIPQGRTKKYRPVLEVA